MSDRRVAKIASSRRDEGEGGATPGSAEVLRQLRTVLDSPRFRNAPVLQKLLRHCVEETVQGRGGDLKISTIAQRVFSLGQDFDNAYDATVRVNALRLRRALELFDANEGANADITIKMERGSYRPQFAYRTRPDPHEPIDELLQIIDACLIEGTPRSHALHRHHVDEGLRSDPEEGRLLAAYADSMLLGHVVYDQPRRYLDKAVSAMEKARAVAPDNELVQLTEGYVSLAFKERSRAEEVGRKVLLKHAGKRDVEAHARWLIAMSSSDPAALDSFALSPQMRGVVPGWMHMVPALAAYHRGNYEVALSEAVAMGWSHFYWSMIPRAAALAQLGQRRVAHEQLDRAVRLKPRLVRDPVDHLKVFIAHDDIVEHVLDGLNRAGLRQLRS